MESLSDVAAKRPNKNIEQFLIRIHQVSAKAHIAHGGAK